MSLLMDALRKAEQANKSATTAPRGADSGAGDAPSVVDDASHRDSDTHGDGDVAVEAAEEATAPISRDEALKNLLDEAALADEQAEVEPLAAKPATAMPVAPSPGPLAALAVSLSLEPITQVLDEPAAAEEDVERARSADAAPPLAIPRETIDDAPTADVVDVATVSIAEDEPLAPSVAEDSAVPAAPKAAAQDDILAEFDEEFAALVRRLEEEEKSPGKPNATPAAATKPAVAAAPVAATTPGKSPVPTPSQAPTATAATHQSRVELFERAANVFAARGKFLQGRTAKFALAGLAVALTVLSSGGYYVYTEANRLSRPLVFLPPPTAALDDGATDGIQPNDGGPQDATSNEVESAPATAVAMSDVAKPVAGEKPAPVSVKEMAPQRLATSTPAVPATTKKTTPRAVAPEASREVAATPSAVTAASLPNAAGATTRDDITLKREQSSPSDYQQRFAQAFSAYQRGDMAAAAGAYEQALMLEPLSRDALLGLAATQMRMGNPQRARELYEQVLHVAPRDAQAAAGLMNLLSESEPLRAESELKFLLRQLPEVADLHFALGNVYVRQSKWSEAQQAFASASTLDPTNADYAFNLGVSLDQIGLRARALDAYLLAQQLARSQHAGFDPRALSARIRELVTTTGQADGT